MTPGYSVRRYLAAGLVSAALTACGDSNGPDDDPQEFNVAAVSAAFAAVDPTFFGTPAIKSFDDVTNDIIDVLMANAELHAVARLPVPSAGVPAAQRRAIAPVLEKLSLIRRDAGASPARSAAVAGILPEQLLGVTFAWDPATDRYVQTNQPGAPANGVGFILYATANNRPVEPLVKIGYAAIMVFETTATTGSMRVIVVNKAGETELDYTRKSVATETTFEIDMEGFAKQGAQRVNFRIGYGLGLAGPVFNSTLTQLVEMPGRHFKLQMELIEQGGEGELTTDLTLNLETDGGDVTMEGELPGAKRTFDVKFFDDHVAQVALVSGLPADVTGVNGRVISDAERDLIRDLVEAVQSGFSFYLILEDPTGVTHVPAAD
jgi:hypothetical protein